jgi:hypothetical protein
VDKYESTTKIAMLLEPRAIKNYTYAFIEENHNLFDYILTHDNYLINKFSNCFFHPYARPHIEENDFFINKKKRLINIIVSNKK